MNFKETIYWALYADIWGFHKKYADVKEDDAFWEQVVDEAHIIYEKYKGKPEGEFAKKLILDVCDELDRTFRRQQNEKK